MKKKLAQRIAVCAVLCMVANTATAQKRVPNIAVPPNKVASDSSTHTGLSIGITGCADTVRGMQAQLLAALSMREMRGLQMGALTAFGGGRSYGVQMSALIASQTYIRGVQTAGLTSVAGTMHGVQLAGLNNISLSPFRGVQLAGFANTSMGVKRGMQMAAMSNFSSAYMRGVQVAAYNYADTLNGSQIGLVNVALNHPRGWQVGLVNYTRDTVAHKIGLVNVNPKTQIDFMAFAGTSTKINFAARFRNRSTYNILGVGMYYWDFDNRFSGSLFYRIGQYFKLGPRWSISGDIGFHHIESFEPNSANKPQRLFSLQGKINVDYKINRNMGVFASLGYGDTRYYSHYKPYRHGTIAEVGLTWNYNRPKEAGRNKATGNHSAEPGDTTNAPYRYNMEDYLRPQPWKAAAEAAGINVLVHCFDRFVLGEDFAKVTFKTIGKNFEHGFVWDNDQFSTNLFAHPYHGNLYFNAARSNGLSFWQAAPYALGGSLMWEFCGEVEPPAINDLMATTFGGMAIGEVTHRLSALLLDDRTHGIGRFLRELAATAVNPMGGFNRIVSGEAWTIRRRGYKYHDYNRLPVSFALSVGNRYLADDGAMFRGEHQPYITFGIEYGDAFNTTENRPYDYFTASATFGFTGNQPFVNGFHLTGRLWGAPIQESRHMDTEFGVFQHFNYYDSKPVKDGSRQTPYRISEAAAFGPGLIYRFQDVGSIERLEQRVFVDGILLGGTKSDYYNVIDRDYNMGSGYSVKLQSVMVFRSIGSLAFVADYYRLYTWKGYEQKDLSTVNPLFLNAQGDKSNAELLVLNPTLHLRMKANVALQLAGSYFIRNTRYKYHPNVKTNTFEVKMGLAMEL